MSRKFRIPLLVLAVLTVCLGLIQAQKKPGGGGGADIPLKAIFSPDLNGLPGKILNDTGNPGTFYTSVRGANEVKILAPSQSGEFVMSIAAKSRRSVQMIFNDVVSPPQPSPEICGNPNFLNGQDLETSYFWVRSREEYQPVIYESPDGAILRIELIPTDRILNLAKMTIGDIRGAKLVNNFQFPGSAIYFTFQAPLYVLVRATDWDSDGVMDWTLTPITVPMSVWDAVSGTWSQYPDGSVPCPARGNVSPDCNFGTYRMPFELRIARLN